MLLFKILHKYYLKLKLTLITLIKIKVNIIQLKKVNKVSSHEVGK